jgi:uncharacterized protein involved in response to NO
LQGLHPAYEGLSRSLVLHVFTLGAMGLIAPNDYGLWFALAAFCWLIAFGIIGIRYTPMLLKPRIDGSHPLP